VVIRKYVGAIRRGKRRFEMVEKVMRLRWVGIFVKRIYALFKVNYDAKVFEIR
jgi:hypothetical protein